MNRKQVTSASKEKSSEELRRELAEHVAAIFANPETPSNLYNAIGDAVTDWTDARDCNSASNIKQDLDAYLQQEEKRKGGAR